MTMLQQSFDRERVPHAHFTDLDLDLVAQTMHQGSATGRYAGPLDPRAYLVRYGGVVADGEVFHPTVAGLLAFAQEPDRWLTASGIDIALYRAEQLSPTQARVRQVRGSIFAVIDAAYAILKEACTISRQENARVVDDLDTPGSVLRELTTNAVAHRDLSVFGSQVRIQVFPRYIEWSSPGGLPSNVTIDTLLTAQFSRNPSLAQFLFHAGYIEKFGMGLDVVSEALRRARLGSPEFHDDGHSFRVRVYRSAAPVSESIPQSARFAAILALFAERPRWRQREMLERLPAPRSTLQRDLDLLVSQGHLVASGATRSRVYSLPDDRISRT
jgi:predicted HTH transcriptional regulator